MIHAVTTSRSRFYGSVQLPKITVYGNRIAIVEIDEPVEGVLALPQNRERADYRLGEVTCVGDKVKCALSVGTRVLFQIPEAIQKTATYSYPAVDDGPNKFVVISGDDVFGTLKELKLSVENFKIAGDWVLCKMVEMKAKEEMIIRPDTASIRLSDLHFDCLQVGDTVFRQGGLCAGAATVLQKVKSAKSDGATCEESGTKSEALYAPGDRIFIERARATPIILNGEELIIIHKDNVIGREQP